MLQASSPSPSILNKASADLGKLVEPVKGDVASVEELLSSNLIDDNPFITELLAQIFKAGGKRIRPALTLLCSRATMAGGQEFGQVHIILAVLTELIHTASLVHDDVIDGASLRRGTQTVNRRFNDRIAVLMGDLLFAQASICLARIMNPVIVGIYGRVLGDLCAGELRQMKQQFLTSVNWDEYSRKTIAKTASLFAAGSHSGAILNGAQETIVEALKTYGLKLGICFQIIDDLLDVVGTSDKLGKQPGSDLRSGIVTAPALFVIERQDRASAKIVELIKTRAIVSDDGSQEAIDLIKQHGGVEATLKMAHQYAQESIESLSVIPSSVYRDSLAGLVDYVLTRIN
jgi:all-trans-nonaprenyl-diphosphate synthase